LRALDVDFYADEFARAGFRGGLNWYRNVDRNSSIPAGWKAQIADMSGRRPVVKGPFEAVVNVSGAVMSTAC
jgi:hypothetical protein